MTDRTLCANALRFLTIDAINQCKSGHPGAPMGMADMAEALWRHVLKHNPTNPSWVNRDRFVLSNGHASMLLYGLLHLSGYDLPLDEIKAFRQMDSHTPGHPEYGDTAGVECTTGPLGQGLAMAVGMALSERLLATTFNRDDFPVIDHKTYVFVGDGCLMEGISQEAISLAGTLKLGKLVVLYDDNDISIDGHVGEWFADDTKARFISAGWRVISNVNGHDSNALDKALAEATSPSEQPTIILCKTIIGCGASKVAGTCKAHGAPFDAEEIQATRDNLHWPHAPFVIPELIYNAWDAKKQGMAAEKEWDTLFANYAKSYPELAKSLTERLDGTLPQAYHTAMQSLLTKINESLPKEATRIANQAVLNAIAPTLPALFGGSADLTSSVGTWHTLSKRVTPTNMDGNYLSYGVREFLMGAMMNGMALYGGFIPYGGTFLVFSDYMRNAIRLSAIMKQRVLYVLTHDSIGLGEDGPTHQPVEHVASLRLIPNLHVWRPCDTMETAVAWREALATQGPTCFCLSRQNLPTLQRDAEQIENIAKGGYILCQNSDKPTLILIATGSEVSITLQAYESLVAKGHAVRLVSMPSTTCFAMQDATYKDTVLPPHITKRLAIEAGVPDAWWQYVGLEGAVIGMTSFGASAPASELFKHFGFTPEAIVAKAESLLH